MPFEEPAGGPNFYRFSDDVKYEIKVDNTGDARPDVTYELRFDTQTKNPSTFLYNTDKITFDAKKGAYTNLNLVQTYTVRKITKDSKGRTYVKTLGRDLLTPPNNVGPRSTPELRVARGPGDLLRQGRHQGLRRPARRPVLRRPGRHVRPDRLPQRAPRRVQHGRRRRPQGLQRQHDRHPGADHAADRDQEVVPTDVNSTNSVVGVYATASRPVITKSGSTRWQQVSRLAEPLINEVVIPLGKKDLWNRSDPADDKQFERHYLKPELAGILNPLYDARLAHGEPHRPDDGPPHGHPAEQRPRRCRRPRSARSPPRPTSCG